MLCLIALYRCACPHALTPPFSALPASILPARAPVDKGGWPSHHLSGRCPAPSGNRVGAAAGGSAYPGCVVNLRQKQAGAFVFDFTRECITHIIVLDACVIMSFASTWGPTTPRRAAAATISARRSTFRQPGGTIKPRQLQAVDGGGGNMKSHCVMCRNYLSLPYRLPTTRYSA